MIDLTQIAATFDANIWTVAKTMPNNPHAYALRLKWEGPMSFDDAVIFIREHGYIQRHKRSNYTCLNVGEFKYWTMGAPLAITRLINRCAVTPDDIADAARR